MSLKAILVDDEKNALNLLENKLKSIGTTIDIVGKASSVKEAKTLIEKSQFDVLFLDIEMRDGSGFDLLESLEEITFEVIFTTAYNQYAIDAFKVNALDYLLKPIDKDELSSAVARAEERLISKTEDVYEKLTNLLNTQNSHAKLALKERGKITFVEMEDILFFKADGVYTEIVTKKDKYVSSNNLGYFENILSENLFSRVHRSYIINIKEVKEYYTTDHHVKLSDGSMIPVSGSSLKGFLDGI